MSKTERIKSLLVRLQKELENIDKLSEEEIFIIYNELEKCYEFAKAEWYRIEEEKNYLGARILKNC